MVTRYTYNSLNRTGVTETQLLPNGTMDTRTVAYQYDNLYRLLSETISGDSQGGNGTITYTYDLTGNRMSRTSNVAGVSTVTDTYNANDELSSEVSGGVTTSYSYDANGNTVESVTGNQSPVTFVYDSQNRLVKQDAGTSSEVDITYDGAGNKVSETVGGVTTKYLIDGNNPTGYSQIVEEIVNGAVTRRYTLGHWIISETQSIGGTWATSFYGYDGHNSVRFLTDSAGAVTDNYTFDAFGIKIAGAGSTPNQILYSGEYLDLGTGDYDLRARVYNENTGTFLTRDTYAGQNGDPITLHQYLYAGADPVNMWDPSGNAFTIPSVLVNISIRVDLFVASAGATAAAAFGEGGQNSLFRVFGQFGENIVDQVLELFPELADAVEQNAEVEYGKTIDRLIGYGNESLFVEAKYDLSSLENQQSLERAAKQLQAAIDSGDGGLVVYSVKGFSGEVLDYLAQQGVEIDKITFISDPVELFNYVKNYFRL